MKTRMMLRGAAIASLALALSAQAIDRTIKVTTLVDEDGNNSNRCSLREAVRAASTFKSYGGCPAGSRIYDNIVQLSAGTYTLTLGEIAVEGEVTIAGEDTLRPDDKNPMTGRTPNRVRPLTTIQATTASRIFYATDAMGVRDVILTGSGAGSPVSGNGGLIYTTENLSLDNAVLENGAVTGSGASGGNGGAIYLAREGSGLAANDTTFRGNRATSKGGAIAMSCRIDLVTFANHDVDINRSLLVDNRATTGAGAIELCGDTNATLSASTLSQNRSPAGAGAISYIQTTGLGVGLLNLQYVTAAEQYGHVLSLDGLDTVLMTGVVMGFQSDAARLCLPDQVAVATQGQSGSYNAFGDDSCSELVSPTGQNTVMATSTLTDVLRPLSEGTHGLTDYYLPAVGSPNYLIDTGEPAGVCNNNDQRDTKRTSGTRCDIGAVERKQLTAEDDEGDSVVLTDRLAVIDVLANDAFAETEGPAPVGGPVGFADNTPGNPALIATPITADTVCDWRNSEDEDYPDKLVVSHVNGEVSDPDDPLQCSYTLIDRATGAIPTDPAVLANATGTVSAYIKNQNPLARKDYYVRPEGASAVTFDPMRNDDDDGDGKYGRIDPNNPKSPPKWEPFFPIEIMSAPQLGTVIGTGPTPSGLCPGSSSEPKTCLAPPLKYMADNNLSPFADTFTYRVYDADGMPSNSVTVTVATDAPADGEGGGSVDLLGGLLLALLGLRRFLKL